jgi:hypothetical protein
MKTLLLALLFTAELAAGDPARDARWQQDLTYLAAQLPQRHPDFYTLVPRAQFDNAVSSLSSSIPALSDSEVMVGMAEIVAMLNDGHTNLYLTQVNSSFHLLPLRLQWFSDGLFVTGAAAAYSKALGARVVQIGNLGVDDAYAAVVPTISHENDIWVRSFSPNYLANADILQALKIALDNRVVTFIFEDLARNRFSLDIAALDPGATAQLALVPDSNTGFTALYRQNANLNYWFTYIESARMLYFAYNDCANMANLPFSDFNQQLWLAFDANAVQTLVVDLRNNTGGNSSVFQPFLDTLSQRMAHSAQVRTYVVIGRKTYSSAILNAISMQQNAVDAQPPLKFVGEPTGGSPNSYGEVATMLLPNSQLAVNYSTRYFSFPQYPPGSMMPDVVVPFGSADYFARHDPFLAAVLADAGANPAVAPALPVRDALDVSRPVAALDENSMAIGAGGVNAGTLIQLFGAGPADLLPSRVFFGAEQADIVYTGADPGYWQANVRIPDVSTVNGQVPIFIVVGNSASNGVTVQVNR